METQGLLPVVEGPAASQASHFQVRLFPFAARKIYVEVHSLVVSGKMVDAAVVFALQCSQRNSMDNLFAYI